MEIRERASASIRLDMSRPVLITHLAPARLQVGDQLDDGFGYGRILELGEQGAVEVGRDQFDGQGHVS